MVDEKKVEAPKKESSPLKNAKQEVKEAQFPSLMGEKEVEVAKRSVDGDSGTVYTKKYVVLVGEGVKPEEYDHTANIKETREFILHAGLRCTGDVVFVGFEKHPDGVSTVMTYEGPVVPAAVDDQNSNLVGDYVLSQQIADKSKNSK